MAPVLSKKEFADCIESRFDVVTGPEASTALVLVSLADGVNTPRLESFVLHFRGPIAPFFPQGIYRLRHEKLGSMEIFLVPMGPDREGMQYEAVFNRLLESA